MSRVCIRVSNDYSGNKDAAFNDAVSAVDSGTAWGITVGWPGGLSGSKRPIHQGSRTLYVEIDRADLVAFGRKVKDHEIGGEKAYVVLFHRATDPTVAELWQAAPEVAVDAFVFGALA